MITPKEFRKRRQELVSKIGSKGIAILVSSPKCMRTQTAEYPYRQDSDFYYLTGFKEPNAVAVLAPGYKDGEYILFNQPKDPKQEKWQGNIAGQEGAIRDFKANQSFDIALLTKRLPEILRQREQIFYTPGSNSQYDKKITRIINKLKRANTISADIAKLNLLLASMRLVKSKAEIALIQQACDITGTAVLRAMQKCRPNMQEYQLQAEIHYEFLKNGALASAFPSIVAGGNNACTLHYNANDKTLTNGDLVLLDVGAEYDYYAADVSRTFPVNGEFSYEQQAIYELVLAAQDVGIAALGPGKNIMQVQEKIADVITSGLVDLGLLQGDTAELQANKAYQQFYCHMPSHFLGLDAHDVCCINKDYQQKLQPNMVLTMEPGIYIPHGTKGIDKKWWGIGIRIEDDIVITKTGCKVLTAGIPKTITDIEKIMKKRG